MTVTSEHSQRASDSAARVREVFLSMAKVISARAIYTSNNPTLVRFVTAFHQSVQAFFADEKELQLRVEQYRILWQDQVVYESEDRTGSIAFMLFKDGVGELTLHSSVTPGELDQLVSILKEEIHNPAPNSDVVTRLWTADFANISYRVLDEDPSGQLSEGRGSGAQTNTSIFQADDHPNLLDGEASRPRLGQNDNTVSIADYLLGVVTASRPETSEAEKEHFVQDMLTTLFSASENERRSFIDEHRDDARGDKIAILLEAALDFTRADDSWTVENLLFLAERTAGFAMVEADARTLTRVLTLIREKGTGHSDEQVRRVMLRLEQDLVDEAFLRSLGRREELSTEEILGVLHYLRLVGATAIPVINELLHVHTRAVVHREACDALLDVTRGNIDPVIETLDVDNVHIARDVVYLLGATHRETVPPVLKELVHYPDLQVRDGVLTLLARFTRSAGDDAISLLCVLLDDEEKGIRVRALAELERFAGDVAAQKVMALCFGEDAPARDADETTLLFEAAGKLAGARVIERLEQKLKKRSWLRIGAQAGTDDKRSAVTALRFISGDRARSLLERLARDADTDVRTRAQSALAERAEEDGVDEGVRE